jgi:hypothetical protein
VDFLYKPDIVVASCDTTGTTLFLADDDLEEDEDFNLAPEEFGVFFEI